jgi:hypothetical protein
MEPEKSFYLEMTPAHHVPRFFYLPAYPNTRGDERLVFFPTGGLRE